MGTYNFSGMYYKDGKASISGLNHLLYDVLPYEGYGNVSKDDLSKDGEKRGDNQSRYNDNSDAKQARNTFEQGWGGMRE